MQPNLILRAVVTQFASQLSDSDGKRMRASLYTPSQPGWLGFRELASPLFPS